MKNKAAMAIMVSISVRRKEGFEIMGLPASALSLFRDAFGTP